MDTPTTQQTIEALRAKLRSKHRGIFNKLSKLSRAAQEAEPDELKGIELQLKILSKQEQMIRAEIKDLGPAPISLTAQDRLLGIALGKEPATVDQALKAIAILMNKEGNEHVDEEPDWDGISDDE